MPRILFLVGVPCSGKSTFRQQMVERLKENGALDQYAFISSDDMVERVARDSLNTYDEVMANDPLREIAMNLTEQYFTKSLNDNKFIVVDRTNMSRKGRSKWLRRALNKGYEADTIVFERPMTDPAHIEWNRRLVSRPGKTIPNFVLVDMFTSYQEPTKDEGFSNILFENTFV